MAEITVRNWRRSRSFGWGWSTVPTGEGINIEIPERPDYVGTYRQLCEAEAEDRAFQSSKSGGAFYATRWFYKGKPIVGTRYAGEWYSGFVTSWLDDCQDVTIRVVD